MSSRVGRKPIPVPSGVDVKIHQGTVAIKGQKGELSHHLPSDVNVTFEEGQLQIAAAKNAVNGDAIAGTTRALLNNNIKGVSEGFIIKLRLEGVGYRAQLTKGPKGATLNLTLGLSHPVTFIAPKGIEIVSPSQTEIEVHGVDKQLVGQVAANIRGVCNGLRKPEPYKGKGIRYVDEVIVLKETKKK